MKLEFIPLPPPTDAERAFIEFMKREQERLFSGSGVPARLLFGDDPAAVARAYNLETAKAAMLWVKS